MSSAITIADHCTVWTLWSGACTVDLRLSYAQLHYQLLTSSSDCCCDSILGLSTVDRVNPVCFWLHMLEAASSHVDLLPSAAFEALLCIPCRAAFGRHPIPQIPSLGRAGFVCNTRALMNTSMSVFLASIDRATTINILSTESRYVEPHVATMELLGRAAAITIAVESVSIGCTLTKRIRMQ